MKNLTRVDARQSSKYAAFLLLALMCFPLGVFAQANTGNEHLLTPQEANEKYPVELLTDCRYPPALGKGSVAVQGSFGDGVNLYSGALNLSIPVCELKVNDNLTVPFALHYDSSVWKYAQFIVRQDNGKAHIRRVSGIPYSRYHRGPFNAGVGFSMGQGRVYANEGFHHAQVYWIDPSWSSHKFYRNLHLDDSDNDAKVMYTRDGTYLRARYLGTTKNFSEILPEYYDFAPGGAQDVSGNVKLEEVQHVEIEFPNGLTHTYKGSYLTEIRDQHGNRITRHDVQATNTYSDFGPNTKGLQRVFQDPTSGRKMVIQLHKDYIDNGIGQPIYGPLMGMIDYIEIDAFNGQKARYKFNYSDDRLTNFNQIGLFRPHMADHPYTELWEYIGTDAGLLRDGQDMSHIKTSWPVLLSIDLPDGTRYGFDYWMRSEIDGGPKGAMSGAIKTVFLPDGGTVDYTYGSFYFPDNQRPDLRDYFLGLEAKDVVHGKDRANYHAPLVGVSKKVERDGNGRILGVTRYAGTVVQDPRYGLKGNPKGPGGANGTEPSFPKLNLGVASGNDVHHLSQERDFVKVVTTPNGDDVVHYFTSRLESWDSGAPMSRVIAFAVDVPGHGRQVGYISQEWYSGHVGSGKKVRSRFVALERDFRPKDIEEFEESFLNRRERLVITVYHDDIGADGHPKVDVLLKLDYDGLGNYRKIVRFSNVGETALRVTERITNPSAGTYAVKENGRGGEDGFSYARGHSFEMIPTSKPWILNLVEVESITEKGQRAEVEKHFSKDGLLLRVRKKASLKGSQSSNDVVIERSFNSEGLPVTVRTFGGDVQGGIPSGKLGSIKLPSVAEFRTDHVYQHGILAKSFSVDDRSGQRIVSTLDQEIDGKSGMPTLARGANGVETRYFYDKLNRNIEKRFESDAAEINTYSNAKFRKRFIPGYAPGESILFPDGVESYMPGALREWSARKTVRKDGGAVLKQTTVILDGFGRTTKEVRKMPAFNSVQSRRFGSNGHVQWETVWHKQANSNPKKRLFGPYDYQGRNLKIVHPDGNAVKMRYKGIGFEETSQLVATGNNGKSRQARTVHYKDALGRLVRVIEDAGGENLLTTYLYDQFDNLIQVNQGQQRGAKGRSWQYDGRGFLVREAMPEVRNPIRYLQINSAGTATRVISGAREIEIQLDEIGRVTQSKDGKEGRLIEEIFYGRKNDGASLENGEIIQQKRHNWIEDPTRPNSLRDIVITETYYFEASEGRLSRRRTRSNTGVAYEDHFDYDKLGNLAVHRYPMMRIDGGSDAFGEDVERTVRFTHSFGYLVGSPGFVTQVGYAPHGGMNLRIHKNGVKDIYKDDPNGIARVSAVQTQGADKNFNTGAIRYDGSGNIWAMGADRFLYDGLRRLKQATVRGKSRSYRFDRYGNLVQMGAKKFPVDPANNQMKSGSYDPWGNVLSLDVTRRTYDVQNMVTGRTSDGKKEVYVYGPGNLRIATIRDDGTETWTLRDHDRQVIREYSRTKSGKWKLKKEFVHVVGLAAILTHNGENVVRTHVHRDHLRSTRLITNHQGKTIANFNFFPFGETLSATKGANERHQFAGHERDHDDQDYMQARFYDGSNAGRFLSVDKATGTVGNPQTWNRYMYVLGNPMANIDPDGQFAFKVLGIGVEIKTTRAGKQRVLHTTTKDIHQHISYSKVTVSTFFGEISWDARQRADTYYDPKIRRMRTDVQVERSNFDGKVKGSVNTKVGDLIDVGGETPGLNVKETLTNLVNYNPCQPGDKPIISHDGKVKVKAEVFKLGVETDGRTVKMKSPVASAEYDIAEDEWKSKLGDDGKLETPIGTFDEAETKQLIDQLR